MTLIKTFDQNIRKLRKERGWTQVQLAFGAEIKRAYLSEIENGQRDVSLDVDFGITKPSAEMLDSA